MNMNKNIDHIASEEEKLKKLPMWPAASIFLLVVMSAILPPGLLTGMNIYLLILAFIAWLASKKPLNSDLVRVVAPFFLILIIGLIIGAGSDIYIYLKDAWYTSNAAIIFCTGYVFFQNKPDTARGLKAFIFGGTLVSLIYIIHIILNPELFSLSAAELRESAGTGYYAPALSFSILCCYFKKWDSGLKINKSTGYICLLVCLLSIILSFSRTIFFVAIFGAFAAAGIFSRKEVSRILLLLIFGIALILTLRMTIDTNSEEATKSFIGKMARTTEELTIQNYNDLRSINLNWRGYETSRALIYYSSGSPLNWLFGYGFGAQVDLGLMMPLGSGPKGERTPIRFVPILHNGFAYLLIKGGLVAVGLFLSTIYHLYMLGRRKSNANDAGDSKSSGRLLQSVAISLAFTTYLIAGVFNKLDMFPYLLITGFLIGSLSQSRESHNDKL